MIKKTLTMLGIVATAFALQSCIDKNYDFDNIDKTIGFNTDLTVRVGSLDTIKLKSVMDLEPDGVVQFVKDPNGGEKDSIFAVIQNGSADIDPIHIAEIKIKNINIDKFHETVNLKPVAARANAPRKISGLPIYVPDQSFTYSASSGEAAVTFNQTGDVPCDVRQLDKVILNGTEATVDLSIQQVPNWIKYGYLDNIYLNLPKGMKVASAKIASPFPTKESDYTNAVSIDGNKIKLTNSNYQVKRSTSTNNLEIKLKVTLESLETATSTTPSDVTFTPNANPDVIGKVTANGTFEIVGDFRFELNDANLDIAALNAEISSISPTDDRYIKFMAGDLSGLMNPQIIVDGPVNFKNNEIEVAKITGKLRHDVSAIEPIKLDDLPDFLEDDGVVLDISNPAILLKAKHELAADVTTAITLTSTIDGNPITVTVNNISVPESTTPTTFYVADNAYANTSLFPIDYQGATWLSPSAGKVADLIKKIPDQIDVDVEPVELTVKDLDITKPFDVDIEYEVFAPLYIGKNFQLVYEDTEDGWAKDLDDIDGLDLDSLKFTALASSNMPADIILTLVPIDETQTEIPQLSISPIEVPAMANKKEVKFVFKPKGKTPTGKDATVNDVIAGKNGVKKLDGIRYKAEIKGNAANDGKALPQDAYIILDDLKVSIKGNISFDAN